jgi:hypothetical protein
MGEPIMKLVLVRPFDDQTIVDPWLVQHYNPKKDRAFEAAFEKALAEVKKANPEEWNLSQVAEKLEAQDWQIIRLETTTVTY